MAILPRPSPQQETSWQSVYSIWVSSPDSPVRPLSRQRSSDGSEYKALTAMNPHRIATTYPMAATSIQQLPKRVEHYYHCERFSLPTIQSVES